MPGIGDKSAERMALSTIELPLEELENASQMLILAKKNGNLEKKGKVMLFLIGLVLGATITSGAFWISQKTNELPVMPNFDMMGENPNGQMPPMGNEPR